jgi:hypothetical protein
MPVPFPKIVLIRINVEIMGLTGVHELEEGGPSWILGMQ